MWFILLLAFSTINWDVFIVKYNINHADSVALDPDYLLSLSYKTLPLLDKNRDKLKSTAGLTTKSPGITLATPADELEKRLDRRIAYFAESYKSKTWLSWNLPDWNSAAYFGINKQ
ncbi:hypothetical protein D3C86_1817320 [compost metagenome]